MGVPAFFRWLTEKYPKVISFCEEEVPEEINGVEIPIDTSKPNPNNVEFDNLYLDMNGIIHPCCHPDDKPAPPTEDLMIEAVFETVDRLFGIIRPRKVVYMAIDGVAPRAKMNQQRSRRFRSAQEAKENAEVEEKLRQELMAQGIPVESEKKEHWDSNVITPGTPFMAKLTEGLRYYVHDRLNNDPGWKGVKVIISDASVPGEGEHKIMDYIRQQRCRPEYEPNTSHVLCGLDADLIMLALATHEPHFTILREQVFFGKKSAPKDAETANQMSKKELFASKPYQFLHINILREYLQDEFRYFHPQPSFEIDFERIIDDFVFMCFFVGNDFLPHMPSLDIREGAIDKLFELYRRNLARMGGYITDAGDINLERAQIIISEMGRLEDQIFARRREQEIRQKNNAARKRQREADRLYHRNVVRNEEETMIPLGRAHTSKQSPHRPPVLAQPAVTTPVTNEEEIDLSKPAEEATESTPKVEEAKETKEDEQTKEDDADDLPAKRRRLSDTANVDVAVASDGKEIGLLVHQTTEPSTITQVATVTTTVEGPSTSETTTVTKEVVTTIEPTAEEETPEEKEARLEQFRKDAADNFMATLKARIQQKNNVEGKFPDEVLLGEQGWKERYYESKFHVPYAQSEELRTRICKCFVEGLAWVMRYYYQGCASWTWYYPFHYAPFASDLVNISSFDIRFELGEPFKPFDQLVCVMPTASSHCLPESFRQLMSDPNSPIIDFYPSTFKIDLNGKRFAWQGVVLLPFIDETRLLEATRSLEHTLTIEERRRNSIGTNQLYVHSAYPLASLMLQLYTRKDTAAANASTSSSGSKYTASALVPIDPSLSHGMSGFIGPYEHNLPISDSYPPPIDGSDKLQVLHDNQVVSAVYELPPHQPHVPKLLSNVTLPEPVLTHLDSKHYRAQYDSGRFGGDTMPDQQQHYNQRTPFLGRAAHRTIEHYTGSYNRGGRGDYRRDDDARGDPFYRGGGGGRDYAGDDRRDSYRGRDRGYNDRYDNRDRDRYDSRDRYDNRNRDRRDQYYGDRDYNQYGGGGGGRYDRGRDYSYNRDYNNRDSRYQQQQYGSYDSYPPPQQQHHYQQQQQYPQQQQQQPQQQQQSYGYQQQYSQSQSAYSASGAVSYAGYDSNSAAQYQRQYYAAYQQQQHQPMVNYGAAEQQQQHYSANQQYAPAASTGYVNYGQYYTPPAQQQPPPGNDQQQK